MGTAAGGPVRRFASPRAILVLEPVRSIPRPPSSLPDLHPLFRPHRRVPMTHDVFASHAVWRNPVLWAAAVPALFAAALSTDALGPRKAALDPLPDSVVA